MSTIVLRSVKGTPLTNTEVDANFNNLNTDKIQIGGTYSTGTAAGVLYLNGSKVLTTGSALTFNGTTLTLTASDLPRVKFTGSTGGGDGWVDTFGTALRMINNAASGNITIQTNGQMNLTTVGNSPIIFSTANAEGMRLTSTGLGIGTSSPTNTLSVTGTANVTGNVTLGDASTDTVTVNGYVGVGGAPSAAQGLRVVSTALTGSAQVGVLSSPVGTSAATSSVMSFSATPGTAASVYTVGSTFGLYVADAAKGAGSTITNQYGVYVSDQAQGAANFGLLSNVSSGTNKWNIYVTGTADNYFAGRVGFGTTSLGGGSGQYRFSGSITGATTSSGLLYTPTIQSDATANAYVFHSQPSTAAAAFTITNLVHYHATQATIGAGSTVTNQFGFNVQSTLTGATNNYGFYGGIASGTGRWNLYMAGTADNYFAGNVGIGTSSPAVKLDVVGAGVFKLDGSGSTTPLILRNNNTASTQLVKLGFDSSGTIKASINAAVYGNDYMTFNVGSDTERMRLDSSGNLGLGVTPSAWVNYNAIQIPGGAIAGTAPSFRMEMMQNAYYSGSGYNYVATAAAAVYRQSSGTHTWYNAPSGTAGAAISFTQAMTLDASGRLLIGTTASKTNAFTSTTAFQVEGTNTGASTASVNKNTADSSAAQIVLGKSRGTANGSFTTVNSGDAIGVLSFQGADGTGLIQAASITGAVDGTPGTNDMPGRLVFSTTADGASSPTERMRIDSSGNVGIGTASPGAKLQVAGNTVTSNLAFGTATSSAGTLSSDTANSGSRIILWGSTSANTGLLELITVPAAPITFATSNAERMRIDASGNLAVGTTTPVARLGVYGAGQTTAAMSTSSGLGSTLYVRDSGAAAGNGGAVMFGANQGAFAAIKGLLIDGANNTSGALAFSVRPATTDATLTEAMRISSTGNVGIGTSSPATKLQVAGGHIRMDDAFSYQWGAATASINGSSASNFIDFYTSGTSRMRLDSSGNLGLGVTPSAWGNSKSLTLNTGAFVSGGSNGYRAHFGLNAYESADNVWRYVAAINATRYTQIDGQHQWFNAPSGTGGNAISFTQAMTLHASGGLSVGSTTDPGAGNISVGSNKFFGLDSNAKYIPDDGSVGGALYTGGGFRFFTGGSERARIDSSGNLLVGTTSSSPAGTTSQFVNKWSGGAKWGISLDQTVSSATAYTHINFSTNGTTVGNINANNTATTYATSSDYRLKDITGPITTSGAYIDSLNPVEGTWKADGSTFVGLIAHEVQEASRTTVATGVKDGEEMQGMDYSSAEIIANLIAEVKSLRQRLAAANL